MKSNWRCFCKLNRKPLPAILLGLVIVSAGFAGCGMQGGSPSSFNLDFKYGVGARNELNTFTGKYTKDMVSDPPITVNMVLSEDELDSIRQKMLEIGFFDYPNEFTVPVADGELIKRVLPYSSYYFRVQTESGTKELRWADEIQNENEQAYKLRELIKFIRNIIENRPEYKKLPKPTSGYLQLAEK